MLKNEISKLFLMNSLLINSSNALHSSISVFFQFNADIFELLVNLLVSYVNIWNDANIFFLQLSSLKQLIPEYYTVGNFKYSSIK